MTAGDSALRKIHTSGFPQLSDKFFIFTHIPASFAGLPQAVFCFHRHSRFVPSFFKVATVVGAQVGNDILPLPIDNGPLLRKVPPATAGFLFISS
jgi:hypothetical protein